VAKNIDLAEGDATDDHPATRVPRGITGGSFATEEIGTSDNDEAIEDPSIKPVPVNPTLPVIENPS
jgi:hypothetical protein